MSTFTAQVDQNPYLPRGATEVTAVVSVAANGPAATAPGAGPASSSAEVVIVDVSGSMGDPITKMIAARAATIAAVDCIPDGVSFGVIAGSNSAWDVYPGRGTLATASDETRAAAADAVKTLDPRGGTAIGQWLRLANDLFAGHPDAIRHAILLTDGKNEHESATAFASAIAACEGKFVCDCRGVGEGWSVDELRQVSSALLGTTEYIREPADMAADFAKIMRASLSKGTNDVQIRVWTPQGANVRYFQQVTPTIEDLTARRQDVNERTGAYPTPPWGDELREYQFCIEVPSREVGEEMLAARVSLVVDDEVLTEAKITAVWTDEEARHTVKNAKVEEYRQEIDKAQAIDEGMTALDEGDVEVATAKLQKAYTIAAETGDEVKLAQLTSIVDVDDTGNVSIKSEFDPRDAFDLHNGSRKTTKTSSPRRAMSATCPAGHPSTTDDYCDVCGVPIGAASIAESAIARSSGPAAATPVVTPVPGATPAEPCPVCGTARSADDRFCEGCGFDLVHGSPPTAAPAVSPPLVWQLTVTADRDYFDRIAAAGVDFPDGCEPRVLVLDDDEITVGRSSRSQGIEPGVDLRAGIEDTGVSHRHAQLVRSPDGSYAVVDVGSINGTTVNGADEPIAADTPVPLQSGDRVHVGAWTTLLIEHVEVVEDPS